MRPTVLMGKVMALVLTVLLVLGLASPAQTQPTGLAGRGTWTDGLFTPCPLGCTLTFGAILLGDGSANGGYALRVGDPGGFSDHGIILEVSPPEAPPLDYWCIIGESTISPEGSWIFNIRDIGDGMTTFDQAKAERFVTGIISCGLAKPVFSPTSHIEGDFRAH